MGNGVATSFDAPTYHRDKARRLERELAGAQQREARLTRLLAVVLERQFRDTHINPLDYFRAIDEIDLMCEEIGLDPIAFHRANP